MDRIFHDHGTMAHPARVGLLLLFGAVGQVTSFAGYVENPKWYIASAMCVVIILFLTFTHKY